MKLQNSMTNNHLNKNRKNRLKKESLKKEEKQSKTSNQISKNLPIGFEDEIVEDKQLEIESLNSENDI